MTFWPAHPQKPRPFLFVGAGLGDVARRFYLTNTYEALEGVRSTLTIVCFSHNPAATEFFRFHPRSRHLAIADLGHVYMALLRDPKVERRTIAQTIFAMCGLRAADQISRARNPLPLGRFHAPDDPTQGKGHVVLHPFGRGWGDWPPEIVEAVLHGLQDVLGERAVYVVAAHYVTIDGRRKTEEFPDIPGVTVVRNLTAPATFNLVAQASCFIGSMSCLAQVAAFERIPSLVLHPSRCRDFHHPLSDYANTIWDHDGVAVAYDALPVDALTSLIDTFARSSLEGHSARAALRDLIPMPLPPTLDLCLSSPLLSVAAPLGSAES